MINLNTLGDMLLRKYTVDFVANMQHLQNIQGNLTFMGGYKTVEEDTDFGILLHKEALWSLYKFREEKSLLYHLCRTDHGRFELTNNPCQPDTSKCLRCRKQAPDEIKGLWTLHNFEWVQEHGGDNV